jgi:hypothetical protein
LGLSWDIKYWVILIVKGALNDPQEFIFSFAGSFFAGTLLGLFFAGLKWRDKNKSKTNQPRKTNYTDMAKRQGWRYDDHCSRYLALPGQKFLTTSENWDRFVQDPIGNLFSPKRINFYGG